MGHFFVYILYSDTLDRYYIGQTGQLDDRLFRHTNSGSKSTKAANDWKLVYSETFPTRSDAMKRENYIKNLKNWWLTEALIPLKTTSFRRFFQKIEKATTPFQHTEALQKLEQRPKCFISRNDIRPKIH